MSFYIILEHWLDCCPAASRITVLTVPLKWVIHFPLSSIAEAGTILLPQKGAQWPLSPTWPQVRLPAAVILGPMTLLAGLAGEHPLTFISLMAGDLRGVLALITLLEPPWTLRLPLRVQNPIGVVSWSLLPSLPLSWNVVISGSCLF